MNYTLLCDFYELTMGCVSSKTRRGQTCIG